MAYILHAEGDDYVSFATPISGPTTSLEVKAKFSFTASADFGRIFGGNFNGDSNNQDSFHIQKDGANAIAVLFTTDEKSRVIRAISGWGGGDGTTVQELRVNWDSTSQEVKIYLDDVLQTTDVGYATFGFWPIQYLFRLTFEGATDPAPQPPNIDLHLLSINVDGAINTWDPNASGGTGSTLPDTTGTNDGTLVNFPVDNSQWVSDGPNVIVDQTALTPGGTISGTYADYTTTPTTLEGIRGSNVISSAGASPQITGLTITPDADPASGSFTATIEPLASAGTQQFLRFSDSAQGVVDPTWRLS